MLRRTKRTALAAAVCLTALGAGTTTALADDKYEYDGYDALDGQSGDGIAAEKGKLFWYKGGSIGPFGMFPVKRGEFGRTAKVYARKPIGCIWVQVTWEYADGSVTVGNSGVAGSVTNGTYQRGFWSSCRRKGQRRPRALGLAGIDYAKRQMDNATLTVCTSRKRKLGPRYCGRHVMEPGGKK